MDKDHWSNEKPDMLLPDLALTPTLQRLIRVILSLSSLF
jgi:hypothetical protein